MTTILPEEDLAPAGHETPKVLEAAPTTAAQRNGRRYANYVLFILCLTNITSVVDRQMMTLLVEPMRIDLGASDTQMSLLTGAAFVLFYSVFGIPIAQWADRGDRRRLLAIGVALWSLATGASGAARTFIQMAVARAAVGVGEATGMPTSLSLIADYYRREVRPQIMAIFNISIQVGMVIMIPILGYVAQVYGWRMALFACAVPGLIVSLLVLLTVREPVRGGTEAAGAAETSAPAPTLGQAVKTMWASPAFMMILLGTAIVGLGAGTLGAWGNAVMMRAFDVTPAQIGAIFVPMGAAATFIGTLAGGYVTTWAVRRWKDERLVVLLPAAASLVAVPGGLLYAFGSSWALTIFGGVLGGLSIGFRTPVYQALMLDLVPPNCRAMAAAASLIATSVVGAAGGPLVVGMISDHLAPSLGSVAALRHALVFAPITLLLGCIPFFVALRYYDRNGPKATASGPSGAA